ncbi:hypothetical protein QY96_03791 [Bacillus thermotolerans]|nr:hypothetical protein QY96_03791 [Bacillus thermotolerans]
MRKQFSTGCVLVKKLSVRAVNKKIAVENYPQMMKAKK